MMNQKEILVTQEGLEKLQSELDHLVSVRREEVAQKIKRAREMGGTDNNAEYEDAKNDQSFVEGRILSLENIIRNAVIVESPQSSGVIGIGSKVLLQNQDGKIEQYNIVGSAESDPIQGKISNESPVGQKLLGKKPGDEVKVETPAGIFLLHILEVS